MTHLQQANEALRQQQYEDAITHYIRALQQPTPLTSAIQLNLHIAQNRYLKTQRHRLRVCVCTSNLTSNAAGRAATLAQLYHPLAHTTILGVFPPKNSATIWPPLKNFPIEIKGIHIQAEESFSEQAIEFILNNPCDLLHLSKPRITNIIIGLLYKLIWRAHVILDIDDNELAFVGASSPISLEEYIQTTSDPIHLQHLYGQQLTRLALAYTSAFDGITVANSALQSQYTGQIIRHARDENTFQPSILRRHQARDRLQLSPHDKVILFLGTPRHHKGLLQTAQAIASLNRTDIIFLIAGDFPENLLDLQKQIKSLPHLRVQFLATQPFQSIPDLLSAADLCILLQDPNNPAAKDQTPAKLTDALAMGIPVLAQTTPGLQDLATLNAFTPVTAETLPNAITHALQTPPNCTPHPVYTNHLTLAANRPPLERHLHAARTRTATTPLAPALTQLLAHLPLSRPLRQALTPKNNDNGTICQNIPPTPPAATPQPNISDTIQQARTAFQRGDYPRSATYWKTLLAHPHLPSHTLLQASRALFKLDCFKDAATALQRAAAQEPDSPNLIREQASQYYYHCYSNWLMRITEGETEWYQKDGLAVPPDWQTACQLLQHLETLAPRNNLRRYIQAHLLLADEAHQTNRPQTAHNALQTALAAIGPQKLPLSLTQTITHAIQAEQQSSTPPNTHPTLQTQLTDLPPALLPVADWLALHDILNWYGLLPLANIAREKALDHALILAQQHPHQPNHLKTAIKAALDRHNLQLAAQLLTALQNTQPKDLETRELQACLHLHQGNLTDFRHTWPHRLTTAQLRLSQAIKGKTIAIVGPAPSTEQNGQEIDHHDLIIRINWRGAAHMPDPQKYGTHTHIALYNAHAIRRLLAHNNTTHLSDLAFVLTRRPRATPLPNVRLGHEVLLHEYPASFYKSLNAVPALIFNLLLLGAEKINIYGVDFYANVQHHVPEYREHAPHPQQTPLERLRPVMANHDLISQKQFSYLTTKIDITHFTSASCQILLFSKNKYLNSIKRIIDNVSIDDVLPFGMLENNIKQIKRNRKGILCVAIVGNSPNILDSNFGEKIDENTIVVRINNYETERYKSDVGTKTDFVLITPATAAIPEIESIEKYKVIVFCNGKFKNLALAQQRMSSHNGCMLNISDINILDSKIADQISKKLGLQDNQWPSTGLLAIAWVMNVFHDIPIHINLYGFSFYKESGERLQHYHGLSSKRDIHHNFNLEENFVSMLEKQGILTLHRGKDDSEKYNFLSIVLGSHYEAHRDTSPCTSIYYGILKNDAYKGEVTHLYTKSGVKEYEIRLNQLITKKRIYIFNGICSYLQNDFVVDSFEKIIKAGSAIAIYWHETAFNINTFRKKWPKNWNKSIEIFRKYNIFHFVPTSQSKQLVMLLTDRRETENIIVVFETIRDTGKFMKNRNSPDRKFRIVGAGIPDYRKGFDIFKKLSLDPDLKNFQFIWHWHANREKVEIQFNGIGNIDYKGYVENFAEYLKTSADLFLLTSRDDPSPIVALESLRSDTPVICFDSTGYAEILPRELVARDYDDMKSKIIKLSLDKEKYVPGFFYDLYKNHTPYEFIKKLQLNKIWSSLH